MYAALILTGFFVLSFLTIRGIKRRRVMSFYEGGRGMMTPGNIVTGPLAIVYGIIIEILLILLTGVLLLSLNRISEQKIAYYVGVSIASLILSILIIYMIKKNDKYEK